MSPVELAQKLGMSGSLFIGIAILLCVLGMSSGKTAKVIDWIAALGLACVVVAVLVYIWAALP